MASPPADAQGPVDGAAPAADAANEGPDAACVDVAPTVGGDERLVAPGSFAMGAAAGGGTDADNVEHPVGIDHPLIVKSREAKRLDWTRVFNDHVPPPEIELEVSINGPITGMSWYGAMQYANFTSAMDGLTACYRLDDCESEIFRPDYACDRVYAALDCDGWRLPTEAEWEYVARGGGAAWDPLPESEGYTAADGQDRLHPAGDHATTHPLGLRDVIGNAAEWTFDCYENPIGIDRFGCDPLAPGSEQNLLRVVKGGSVRDASLRLAMRRGVPAVVAADADTLDDVGVRLVRTPRSCRAVAGMHRVDASHMWGAGFAHLGPVAQANYAPYLPFLGTVALGGNHLLATLTVGDGTPSDKTHLRLIDINGDAATSDQPDFEFSEFQPSDRMVPLWLLPEGSVHREFAVVSASKYDPCRQAGVCRAVINRLDPERPLAEASAARSLSEGTSHYRAAFSLEPAGHPAEFAIPSVPFPGTDERGAALFRFKLTANDVVPVPPANPARILPDSLVGSISAAAVAVPGAADGAIVLLATTYSGISPDNGPVIEGTSLAVVTLDGAPYPDVPVRRLGDFSTRPEQSTVPLVVQRGRVFVVGHLGDGVPWLFAYSLDSVLHGPPTLEVLPGFPVQLETYGTEVVAFQGGPQGLTVAFAHSVGNDLTSLTIAQISDDGVILAEPWPYSSASGWGAAATLPDGRVFVLSSGYWDHRVYSRLLGTR